MHKEAVLHICDSSYVYAVEENRMVFKIRTKKNDVNRVVLFYGDKYDDEMLEHMKHAEMELAYSDEFHDYFEVEAQLDFNRLSYYFMLHDENETLVYAQERFMKEGKLDKNKLYLFPYICRQDIYRADKEWEKLVVYQIFVDRFNRIDKDKSWYRMPGVWDIYGGNLAGIIDKLDYIKKLGVNCLYLTPVFESPTNHKYNTVNYFSVDNAFGDESILKELIEKCHVNGIKVVLDAVFNHTAVDFFAFKDVQKNGKASKYYDWYFINNDMEYETFGYAKGMPKLNTGNKEVSDYLIDIGKYWVREFDIDGWRLDVANEIDHKFWRKFRDEVKHIKENAIIIGEVWDFGESYLQGDQYDSIMNYPFMNAVIEFFARRSIDVVEFDYLINNIFARYKRGIRNLLLNLIGSHDTSRFLNECGEDVEKLKMAVFFQMTSIGIPMVYYGDEAGLTGKNDPDCRRTIDFDNMNTELYEFYSKLIHIRKESQALTHGQFKTIYARDGVYAYCRFTDKEEVIAIFNNENKLKNVVLNIDSKFTSGKELIDENSYDIKNGILDVRIQPHGKMLIKLG